MIVSLLFTIGAILLLHRCEAQANFEGSKEGWAFRENVFYGARSNVRIGDRANPNYLHEVKLFVKMRNMDKLEKVLHEVSDPDHEAYGNYWTREQIADLTADIPASRKIVRYLEAHGVRVKSRSAYEEILVLESSVSVWEHLFATEFYEFHHKDWEGEKVVRALKYSLPTEINEEVDHVMAVVTFPLIGNSLSSIVTSKAPTTAPMTSVSQNGLIYINYVTPTLLNTLYNIPSNTGNSSISQAAFFSFSQYVSNPDIQLFMNHLGLPSATIAHNLGVPGYMNSDICNAYPLNCLMSNTALEYMMGVAQNVPTTHMHYDNLDIWSMMANITASRNPPKIVILPVMWYGLPINYVTSFNNYAIIAGTMGISILASSGDDGVQSFNARGNTAQCGYAPAFPAYSPYVIAIGTTQVSNLRIFPIQFLFMISSFVGSRGEKS
jgi:tripeptidyl-peptidase-1